MTDPEPFYAAIRTAPDDDLPRLVFADWLDENGQPERAEYLRLTCAIAREPDGEQKTAWSERARVLHQGHRQTWFGSILEAFRVHRVDRGFVTTLTDNPTRFYTHAAEVERFAPCLSTADVSLTGADAGVVLSLGFVQRLRSLLFRNVAPASLDSLTAHVELPNLRDLFLQTNGLDNLAEGVRFVEWDLPRTVPTLRLSIGFGCIEGADPALVLTSVTRDFLERHLDRRNLRALRLWGITDDVARTFAHWPGLNRLTELNLHNCCVTTEALPILLPRLQSTRIELLRLGHNMLSDSAAVHIASAVYPPSLRELRLDRNRFGDRGVEALIASPHLKSDLILHIGNNVFGGRSAARLRERFPNVRF